jgi:ribonuclease HI
LDSIKLNTDAAVRSCSSTIAVIARDNHGHIRKAWTSIVPTVDPDIAEALAIKWALQLAKAEDFTQVIVESDSKKCIETFTGSPEDTCWKLDALYSDVNSLALDFVSVCFSWVKRDTNSTAHELAKFAASLNTPFNCNASPLPPSVLEAWQRDSLGSSA